MGEGPVYPDRDSAVATQTQTSNEVMKGCARLKNSSVHSVRKHAALWNRFL